MVGRLVGGGAVSLWGWIGLTGLLVVALLVLYTLSSVLVSLLVLVGAGRRACLASSGMTGPMEGRASGTGSLGASGGDGLVARMGGAGPPMTGLGMAGPV